jgi:arginyl-tRNA synthetase
MKTDIEQAITEAMNALFDESDVRVELTRPDEQFGDYATNVALQLAGKLHKNPREVADALAVKIRENLHGKVADVSVAGPGFLNIRLSDEALIQAMSSKPAQTWAGKTVSTEYSDPNPFKPLHAGHLYTTLMGDIISRLYEQAGANVLRINYTGDVGRHVAITMWAIINTLGGELPEKLPADLPLPERLKWLGARYVEGNSAFEDDEAVKAEILAVNKRVYQIHAEGDHDSPFAQIYWTCRTWSYDYFKFFYEQLQVKPFTRYLPESEVTPAGVEAVKAHISDGVYTESDGAIVFDGEKYGLHTRVFITTAGLPTYEAKEVGLILTKWRDYHFDWSVIITANEIDQYMAVVYKSIEQFEPELVKRSKHLTHGVVKLQGGVKMSSRKGNIVTAQDILEAARQTGAESGTSPSEETVLAAVKYAFAKNRIGGDIAYDPKESVALEGNSGPYLQYAHARARSILKKATTTAGEIDDLEPAERSLARKISEYAEVVDKATSELLPHYICTYLYELAQVFNSFYEHNRVVGSEREATRLTLVQHYADTLKAGLELLGIVALDTM